MRDQRPVLDLDCILAQGGLSFGCVRARLAGIVHLLPRGPGVPGSTLVNMLVHPVRPVSRVLVLLAG